MPVTFQIMTFPVDGEGRHGVANTVFVLLSYTSYSVDGPNDVAPGGTYQMSTCLLRLHLHRARFPPRAATK